MGVAQRRVGDEEPLLVADPLREPLGAELAQLLAHPVRRGRGAIRRRGHRRGQDARRVVALLHVLPAVDDDVREVRQDLRRAIPGRSALKQLRCVVDERRRRVA